MKKQRVLLGMSKFRIKQIDAREILPVRVGCERQSKSESQEDGQETMH